MTWYVVATHRDTGVQYHKGRLDDDGNKKPMVFEVYAAAQLELEATLALSDDQDPFEYAIEEFRNGQH